MGRPLWHDSSLTLIRNQSPGTLVKGRNLSFIYKGLTNYQEDIIGSKGKEQLETRSSPIVAAAAQRLPSRFAGYQGISLLWFVSALSLTRNV
jgi:hypothetical protein